MIVFCWIRLELYTNLSFATISGGQTVKIRFIVFFVCIVTATLSPSHAEAEWEYDGTQIYAGWDGYPVMNLRMVNDGMCGAIIAWHLGDFPTNNVQRINWNCELQYLPDPDRVSQHGGSTGL